MVPFAFPASIDERCSRALSFQKSLHERVIYRAQAGHWDWNFTLSPCYFPSVGFHAVICEKKRYCEKDESALQPDVIEGCDRAILDHRASYYSSLIFTGEPHRMLHPSHAEHCIRDDPQEKEDLSGKVLRAARRFTHLHCKLTGPRGCALATAADERSSDANSSVLHTSFLQKSFSGAGLRGPREAAECKQDIGIGISL